MKFRLANLLRVRALQEESAAADAARAAGRAREARAASARRREALATSATLGTRGGELAFAAAVAARSASTHLFTESLTLADQADGVSTLAQAELAAARRRVRALERLAERARAAEADEALRAEQAELDEHASRAQRVAGPGAGPGEIDLHGADAQGAEEDCPDCRATSTSTTTSTPTSTPTATPAALTTTEPSR